MILEHRFYKLDRFSPMSYSLLVYKIVYLRMGYKRKLFEQKGFEERIRTLCKQADFLAYG
jgi:hypothetical protein